MTCLLWVRSRRRRRRHTQSSSTGTLPATPQIQAAEEIRQAIIDRFGTAYVARTTEELRDDPRLCENLGTEVLSQVVSILSTADVEKFGGKIDDSVNPSALAQRLSALLASIRAGAISSKSGRWSEPISGPMRRETTATSSETKA
jgi:hypothetical protein